MSNDVGRGNGTGTGTGTGMGAGMSSGRRILAVLGLVIANAVLQALLVLPDPYGLGWAADVLALVSLGVLAVCVAAVAVLLARGARASLPRTVLWSAIGIVVVFVAAAIFVLPGFLVIALVPMPIVAAAGGEPALRGAGLLFRRRPIASLLTILLGVVLAVPLWVLAFASSFFITGSVSSLLTWLLVGLVGTGVIAIWTRIQRGRRSHA